MSARRAACTLDRCACNPLARVLDTIAIFYTTDEQRRVAEDTIADVDESGLWPGNVLTEIVPAGEFWEAKPEHQDYLEITV